MSMEDTLDRTSGLDSLKHAIASGIDEDVFAMISSLMDQNAELIHRLQELTSQKEPASGVVSKAHKQEETSELSVEKEAMEKASAIIREAEMKAKVEADKILAEARRKGEGIVEEKTQFAVQQGLLIINKAQERALAILNEVQQQAEAIASKSNHKGRR